MRFRPRSEKQRARAITRLVDGSTRDAERAAVDEWGGERPEVQREVASQRRVARALRTGAPAASDRLVEAVQARFEAPDHRRAPGSLPRWLASVPAWQPAAAGAALLAVCAVVAILVVGTGTSSSGPSIPAAAGLAFAPSTGAAPATKNPKLLDISYGGVTYPNYAQFAVLPTGTRVDRIGGRPALTVFYRLRDGSKLSYTVFSGKPIPLPRSAKAVVFDGVPLHVFSTPSGLAVVTLVRFGRTCVLAAPTGRDAVLSLAAAPVRQQSA